MWQNRLGQINQMLKKVRMTGKRLCTSGQQIVSICVLILLCFLITSYTTKIVNPLEVSPSTLNSRVSHESYID